MGLHVKSLSNVVAAWTITNADCAPAPIFDTIWTAGNVVEDDVVNPMTTESPWAQVVRVQARSGEAAPLNTHRDGSLTVPDCTSDGVEMGVGLISYHRNSVLVVPFITAWPVQTTIFPMWDRWRTRRARGDHPARSAA